MVLFGDLDCPLKALRRYVSIGFDSCFLIGVYQGLSYSGMMR